MPFFNVTKNREIQYALGALGGLELYSMAQDIGYSCKKSRKDIVRFLNSLGLNSVHYSIEHGKKIFGNFAK